MHNTESINLILAWPHLLSCENEGDFHPLRNNKYSRLCILIGGCFFPRPDVCLATVPDLFGQFLWSFDLSLVFVSAQIWSKCQALCRQVRALRIRFKWFNSTQLDSAESIKRQVKLKKKRPSEWPIWHKQGEDLCSCDLSVWAFYKFVKMPILFSLDWYRVGKKIDFLGFWHEASLLEIVKRLRRGWMFSLANVFKKWGNLAGSHGFNILFFG